MYCKARDTDISHLRNRKSLKMCECVTWGKSQNEITLLGLG